MKTSSSKPPRRDGANTHVKNGLHVLAAIIVRDMKKNNPSLEKTELHPFKQEQHIKKVGKHHDT